MYEEDLGLIPYEEDDEEDELQLVEHNPDPLKSEVMCMAADYRAEGMSPSEALSTAWAEAKGEPDNSEDDDDEVDDDEGGSTFQPSLIMLALVGVGGWLAYYYWKNKRMPWQPAIARFIPPRPVSAMPLDDSSRFRNYAPQVYEVTSDNQAPIVPLVI